MTAAAVAAAQDALAMTYKRAPMEFVRGEGVELIDAEGRRYLDFVSGIAVNALGYGDAGFKQAVLDALECGVVHTSNLYRTAPGERLAEALVSASFADRVFFCNSGAEANEGAFKFARRWGRTQPGGAKHEIVSLRGAFHGRLFGTLAATDRPQYRIPFRPLAGGITIAERDLEDLAHTLDRELTAAVVAEPVQGEGGVRVLDHGFLRELRALTTERNVLLMLDEIQCGYGRTGTFFAYEQAGIEPDLLTIAKPMAGGLPMGAILMTQRVADAMKPGDHGTTFGGGPFVASVALHVFERLRDPAMLAHVRTEGRFLGEQLCALAETHPKVRAVRGVGFMYGIDVTEPAAEVIARARALGLLLVSAGEHTLRLLPPLVMPRAELARGVALLTQALDG